MIESTALQGILPWNKEELEALLKDLVEHGTETAKVDFKAEIETRTPEQKAELLKDISAIANTYDDSYRDHGFLVYGVKGKAIAGISQTERDTDKLQNHIEQILKTYISPMPQIYLIGFEAPGGVQWGAIVIPPRNNKPHMFVKDLSCADQSRTRRKGEWFVRRGATTDPGLPEDLALIMQRQLELSLAPLKETVANLQWKVARAEEQYNSALFNLVERAISSSSEAAGGRASSQEEADAEISKALGMDLPSRFRKKLRKLGDALADELIVEAKLLREFLDGPSAEVPWAPQLNRSAENKKIIEVLEEKTRALQLCTATILTSDHDGIYANALVRAIKLLAKTITAPIGVGFNRIGEAVRYYPLGLILYTAFVTGVAAGRADILQHIAVMEFKDRQARPISRIGNTLFYLSAAKSLFNDAFAQRWCEPIAQRVRQVLNDHLGELTMDLSEPEWFFHGEFVLALTGIDARMSAEQDKEFWVPLPGLYLYMSEARDVVAGFLRECPDWFRNFYRNPLEKILNVFDQNAAKVVTPGCFATGLFGKTAELYK